MTTDQALLVAGEIKAAIVEACCFYGAIDANKIAERAMEAILRIGADR